MSPSFGYCYRRVKDSNIIDGYLVPGYDPLHTFSRKYITDEVIDFMKEKGNGIAALHCRRDEYLAEEILLDKKAS
ncbi:MAG: DUF3791 domain-containing protein [Bacteroidales bacterium]|nr:DUF3791 domain-containing protein [Bacteroidales bacterium]